MEFLFHLTTLTHDEIWNVITFVIIVSIFFSIAHTWNQPGIYFPIDKDELKEIWKGEPIGD